MAESKKESPFLFYRREWLNLPGEGNAFIEAEVRKPYREDEYAYYDGGELTIKDCNRQIMLSFPVSGNERRANSLHKIAELMAVIEHFQAVLLYAANEAERVELRQAEEKDKRSRLEKER